VRVSFAIYSSFYGVSVFFWLWEHTPSPRDTATLACDARWCQNARMQLARIADELRGCSKQAAALAEGLDAGVLSRRPKPESWSAAEAIEHLSLTTESYLPRIDAALAEARGRDLRGDGPFRMELMARFLKWLLEPPARLRVKTSAPFQPVAVADPAAVVPRFLTLQEALLERVDAAHGLALDKVKVASPFAEQVKYNAYSAFVLVAAHERRHLWQASRALQDSRG
jgi:hypothetical protein